MHLGNRIGLTAGLLAGLALTPSAARADSFVYTGSLQQDTIATSGTYAFTLSGGQGGSGEVNSSGGHGAVLTGDYVLTAGTVLDIVVGGKGTSKYTGGGGGGTFIYVDSTQNLLAAAGGGGGGSYQNSSGSDAQTGTDGGSGGGFGNASGGSSGSGGSGSSYGSAGGGGGGFYGAGGAGGNGSSSFGLGGSGLSGSFAGGGGYNTSSGAGGYGGGAGAGGAGGGGGGGYSGGGGGNGQNYGSGGGGGGSYFDPSFTLTTFAATNTGNGAVTLTLVGAAVPEPSSILMTAGGLALAGLAAWRRRKAARA